MERTLEPEAMDTRDGAKADALVALHAADDSEAQRALFRDSLHAALTPEELERAARKAGLLGFELRVDSDRHASIQIAAHSPASTPNASRRRSDRSM